MAVGDPYISVEDMKSMLGITNDDEDAELTRAVMAAYRAIDNSAGKRSFWLTDLQTRTIETDRRIVPVRRTPTPYYKLIVPDIGATAGFAVTGFAGAALMETTELLEGRPIKAIRLPWGSTFTYGEIAITAQWGWPSVPDDIIWANQTQAQRYYRRKGSPEGIAGTPEWGLVTIPRLDPDVRKIVTDYQRSWGIG